MRHPRHVLAVLMVALCAHAAAQAQTPSYDAVSALGVSATQARDAWKRLDQPALERALAIEATVPNVETILRSYTERSNAARTTLKARLDVPYGALPAERLDIFPADQPGAPILLYIHGGGWARSRKEDWSYIAAHFVPRGVTVVLVGYPLVQSGASVADIGDSTRRAYEWVARHADTFGGNPRHIVVAGNSAGAHLSAIVATTDWRRRLGSSALAPAAVIAVSGVFDMEPHLHVPHNKLIKLDLPTARRASPLDFIADADPRTRLVAVVGGRETPEFVRQSVLFHSAWLRSGRRGDLLLLGDEDHFSIMARMADPSHPLTAVFHAALGISPPQAP